MQTHRGLTITEPPLQYNCPRCGDRFQCASEEELFAVTTHRLLHQASAWRRSLWSNTLLAMAGGAGGALVKSRF